MPTDFGEVADLIQAPIRDSRLPGLQYVVVNEEDVLFEAHLGSADLAASLPMLADTTMNAYSMSKTVTAVATLQLIDRGKLSLNSPVARILPWQPYGEEITVQHLLSHTGGLPNPIPLKWAHAAVEEAFDERAALAAVLRHYPRRTAAPGTRYAYSNIGYWLLGYVIEAVTGQQFKSYIAEHIVRPLGLNSAQLGFSVRTDAQHACGYLERYSLVGLLSPWLVDRALLGNSLGRWRHIQDHYPDGAAFGGLIGSGLAFGRFLQDQLGVRSRLLSDSGRRLLEAQQRTVKGPVPMTLGWHIGSLGHSAFLFKEGGGAGFHSMMRLYRFAGIGTVLMTNGTRFNVSKLLDSADAMTLRAVGAGRLDS